MFDIAFFFLIAKKKKIKIVFDDGTFAKLLHLFRQAFFIL